ncbi:MAG: hypothetical protein JF607_14325, partial [Burkholderiales bacterium]|nr:hypothetical protein [Burkholderiales bacterium]
MKQAWRWAVGGLLGLLVLAGLVARHERLATPLPPVAAASAPAVASMVPAPVASLRPDGLAGRAPAAEPATASPPPAAASGTVVAGSVDVCGFGRVSREELDRAEGEAPPAWAQALNERSAAEQASLLKRLAAGTERQRVAAAVLNGDVQMAAQLATSTTDPVAYQMGLRACRGEAMYRQGYAAQQAFQKSPAASSVKFSAMRPPGPVSTNCSALSVERWELLDPGNASPWIMRLHDGMASGDQNAVTQALYQVAQRSRVDVHLRALSSTVADVVSAAPTLGEFQALTLAAGQDRMTLRDVSIAGVGGACRVDALRDANRRQLCDQVVRQMPDLVSELADARILHTLEEGLGISHSRRALPRDELERLMKV